MRFLGFPLFIALSVLGMCGLIIYVLGNVDVRVYPSTTSGDPGGAMAFYELLERSGVKVERLFRVPSKQRRDIGVVVLFQSPPAIYPTGAG